IPLGEKKTKNEIDKLIFIGELKAKLSFYEKEGDELDELNELLREMKSKEELKTELEKGVVDVADRKESTLRLLDENVQSYFDMSKDAIIDYANYKTTYNYKEKKLQLRREKSNLIEKVGSSSNHMFLHLCLILGIQELVIRQQSPYVPYWLILDQPSRPYFSDESEPAKKIHWKDVIKSDRSRITIAMKLLNDFITYVKEELNTDYQIILLEHIPKSIWDEAKLDNFHLVEKEFTQGNALIRFDDGGEPY
ncbi:DUF3732 domain-containing protein, partial [Bacillus thuringiensis]|nr:DUF3732 domain-containing protein [Bacillus thuringiensis]